ncbi:hypothetical protein B5X24_HaOG209369 [Helicoverpa armigera]|nr:hypothetical protein B5X24_HaOG209369 [Helicoverpa armigera]
MNCIHRFIVVTLILTKAIKTEQQYRQNHIQNSPAFLRLQLQLSISEIDLDEGENKYIPKINLHHHLDK